MSILPRVLLHIASLGKALYLKFGFYSVHIAFLTGVVRSQRNPGSPKWLGSDTILSRQLGHIRSSKKKAEKELFSGHIGKRNT